MKALIFFDINGTIIKRDHRTDLPFGHAVEALLGQDKAMEGVDTTARSDHDVFMEVLKNAGVAYSADLWHEFLGLYQAQLEVFKTSDVWRENADACQFIKALHDQGYYLALITGELEIGAKYKLEKLGVWQYFKTGGFGEDGLRRFDIADAARQKAKTCLPEDYDKAYVIGDTILDIQTARHLGLEIISIATGSHSKAQLEAHHPDYLIETFADIHDLFL